MTVSQSARTHIGNLRPPATVVEPGDPSLYYAAFKASAAMYIFEGSNLLARRTVVDTVDGLVGSRNIELVQSSVLNSPQLLSDILRSVCKSSVLDRKDRYMRFAMPTGEFFQDFM